MTSTCALSVLVCTRNRRESLLETLDSVAPQVWPQSVAGAWEVLVVDNGSEDGSAAAAEARAADFPVDLRVEVEAQPGLSFGRNHALRTARGRAVVFIDDDVTCQPGWLAAHARAFDSEGVVGVGGPIRPAMPRETPPWFTEILADEVGGPTSRYEFGDEPADIVANGPVPLPFGANMGVLREVALEVGGFRTDLGWGKKMIPSEEFEFFRRVQARGGRIVYAPEAVLLHRIEPRRTSKDYYRKWQQGYGRSLVLMDPPAGVRERFASVRESLRELRRWRRKREAAHDTRAEMEAVREGEREKGRLKQLLCL